MMFLLLLSMVSTCESNSCYRMRSDWNKDKTSIPVMVNGWLQSVIFGDGDGGVESRMFHPVERVFTSDDDGSGEDDRRLITVGKYTEDIPHGLTWQYRGSTQMSGFLYGQVDEEGEFTGADVTFIYPDFLTGLRGSFVGGVLEKARAVDVVGERCKGGVKELMLEASEEDEDVVWERLDTNDSDIGQHPTVMDPHERKSVYVGESGIKKAGEGLFAKKLFSPGDLISYYGGQKVLKRNIIHKPNMTLSQISSSSSYLFSLGLVAPSWWGYPSDLLLDVGAEYRAVESYRTTLAHKANHAFLGSNAFYAAVDHPAMGGVGCLVAIMEIAEDEEIFVDYDYDIENGGAPKWYVDAFAITDGWLRDYVE